MWPLTRAFAPPAYARCTSRSPARRHDDADSEGVRRRDSDSKSPGSRPWGSEVPILHGSGDHHSVAAFMFGSIEGGIGGSEDRVYGRAILWEARDS